MSTSLLGAYLITITVLMLTPGPDMLFALASGIKGGSRAGFFAAVGAAAGEVVHITAAALGLAAIFRAAPLGVKKGGSSPVGRWVRRPMRPDRCMRNTQIAGPHNLPLYDPRRDSYPLEHVCRR